MSLESIWGNSPRGSTKQALGSPVILISGCTWNCLRSSHLYEYLDPIPREADLIGLGYGLSIRSFNSSQVMFIGNQDWE